MNAAREVGSPLPSAGEIDARIEQHLAEFDEQRRRSRQDGPTIRLSPKDAEQIRLALMMALERTNDVEFEQMVRAAYQLLHTWATTPAASNAEGDQ
jgi:hypothetical protein